MTDHTVNQTKGQIPKRAKAVKGPQLSQPTIKRKVTVSTVTAQNIMDYNFSRLEFSLFSLDVSLLFTRQAEKVEEYERATKLAYDNLKAELEAALHNTKKIATSHGITDEVFYDNVREYDLTIRSPRAVAFLNLILLLDQLVMAVDSLWINDADLVGGNTRRIEHHREWQKRINLFIREIIRFQIKQYKEYRESHSNQTNIEPAEDKSTQATAPTEKLLPDTPSTADSETTPIVA